MTAPHPPGPSAWTALRQLRGVRRDPLGFFASLAREHGDVAMARIGPRRICLVSDPELVQEVLVGQQRNVTKTRALKRAGLLLGQGLLTSEGDFWLRQRRLMQPAFHRDRIAGYADAMVMLAQRTRDSWRDGGTIEIHEAMMRLTLAIAALTLFGARVDEEAEEIGRALDTAISMFPRLTAPFSELLDRLPLAANRRFAEARARLDATIHRMIRERRASGEDRGDLLSMLLAARDEGEGGDGRGMTDEQVRDEALTLLLAGHETTANALTWTWYLLARHPEAEARLHAELDGVLGDRTPAMADVAQLPVTRATVAEAMRLYPPAYVVGRAPREPFMLGGYDIPAGTMVFMSQWVIHRDARWFPDPARYDPTRWTPAMERALPRFAYFPFGGGPRKCIGESFAWTEAVLVLATLARRWRLRLAEPGAEPGMRAMITLRPARPIMMRVEARSN